MTWYLTLRPDAAYSHPTPTAPLLAFLAAQPELRQSGPMAFESAPGQPSLHLVLACCRPDGSYTCDGILLPQVNVIELLCSYLGDPGWYESLSIRIAELLGWSVFEDTAERQVWPRPEPQA